MARRRPAAKVDQATRDFLAGQELVRAHPLFRGLATYARLERDDDGERPEPRWMWVSPRGVLSFDGRRRAAPEEWGRAIAHGLVHLGLGHHQEKSNARAWNAGCCVTVERLLTSLRFGRFPADWVIPDDPGGQDEDHLDQVFQATGLPSAFRPDLVIGLHEPHDRWTG